MDHPTSHPTPNHRTTKLKADAGLGWAEFFQWLGQQSVAPERRASLLPLKD